MTRLQRERAFESIAGMSLEFACGVISVPEIDSMGIGPANRLALEAAVHQLQQVPDVLMCDALVIEHPSPQVALIDGDARSVSVAAASIVAKVTRDHMMQELNSTWAGYGFDRHVGYGTPQHLAALRSLGPCPIHRHTFAPVREASLMNREPQ